MTDYFDLGPHSRAVTTASADAQRWFDRGLNWIYGYNQDEAARCFQAAIEADPGCAMAHWGRALALGPYLNKEWRFYSDVELASLLPLLCVSARVAESLSAQATPTEQALCRALVDRYPSMSAPDLETMVGWDAAYATAMADVQRRFPDDLDVIALTAEALMMKTPWRLWDLDTGEPSAGAATGAIVEMLQHGATLSAAGGGGWHPGVAHMMCHALEMSQRPEAASDAADGLRDLAPDIGHLNHMPGHIDVLCGRYRQAVETSERAIAADRRYLARVDDVGQYRAAICHDNHLMMFASMLLGRWSPAIAAADMIVELVDTEVLEHATPAFAITLEAYHSMRMHVFVRFGRWEEALTQPPPPDNGLFPVTTAIHHYARAVSAAALGRPEHAAVDAAAFDDARTRISPDRHFFNNTAHDVLAVAGAMMGGELAYHRGDHELAFDLLRTAVRLNDELHYTEPWAWMHPPRHALGALLLEQGQVQEAEQVYRADLGLDPGIRRPLVHPDNIWSLHGHVECLERSGRQADAEAARSRLEVAQRHADGSIVSSCACRMGVEGGPAPSRRGNRE